MKYYKGKKVKVIERVSYYYCEECGAKHKLEEPYVIIEFIDEKDRMNLMSDFIKRHNDYTKSLNDKMIATDVSGFGPYDGKIINEEDLIGDHYIYTKTILKKELK